MTAVFKTEALDDFESQLSAVDELEPAALRSFYDHYKPMLVRHAQRQGAADPEGVADLAFFDGLRAVESLRSRTERSFRSYIFRAATNRIVSENRRGSLELTTLGEEEPICRRSEVDNQVVESNWVGGLLDTLSEDQRAVIQDRFFVGYSAVETAARLGKSPGAVRKIQHDALVRLRHIVLVLGIAAVLLTGVLVSVRTDPGNRIEVDRPASEQLDRETTEPTDLDEVELFESTQIIDSGPNEPAVVTPSETEPNIEIDPTTSTTQPSVTTTAPTATTTAAGQVPTVSPPTQSGSSTTLTPTTGASDTWSSASQPGSVGTATTLPVLPVVPALASFAPPVLAPVPPSECETTKRTIEIEQIDGTFVQSYRFFDRVQTMLYTSDELIEEARSKDTIERAWKTTKNPELKPQLIRSVAAVSPTGQMSSPTACVVDSGDNEDGDDDRNDDERDSDQNDDDD